SYGNIWNRANAFRFSKGKWTSFYNNSTTQLGDVRDYVTLAVDPLNPDHVFVGSWGWGIAEYLNGTLQNQFTDVNSSLRPALAWNIWIGVGGLAFDSQANLWATNSITSNILSVRKSNNTWRSFDLSPYNTIDAGQLIIDQYDQKWIVLRNNNGLLVFNDNNTIDNPADDKVKNLTNSVGKGNLPGNKVTCIASDKDGVIWIGSDKGVSAIYNPGDVFTGANYDAQTVMVVSGDVLIPLLENETITAIAVDGANQKWFGTANSGAFLISADGSRQILHFTSDNSPLLSNTISCIGINVDGEVFFGTDKGMVSYRGTAAEPAVHNSGAFAFPNPVRPNYYGSIAIKGLTMNADVKITDITGHLVYQTKARGGQAIWDGNDLKGKRAVSGVYLVFASNSDGTDTVVTKILIVR
ncbi:MAG: two-component regulator propeller domain-containing protein, partial [Bacteroidota bacterium]|nr:two-component regulator propeller domain-containing protein [Bacteroidota bacterium]